MKTIMGFDYGSRKIGVAIGQTLLGTAQGISSLAVANNTINWSELEKLINIWKPSAFVVGLPLSSSGEETQSSKLARNFGNRIANKFTLPVYWVNEFLTSQSAQSDLKSTLSPGQRFTKRKQKNRDLLAAELILRSYFETNPTDC